jgi:spermidine/putrescine transport system permease protein
VLLVTLVPIGVMILYSFNQAPNERISFTWQGFTSEWYQRLFEIPDLTSALVTSLEVAALSTVIAVAIGTPAALALARYRFWGRGSGDLVILADIAAPSVVVGASLLGLFVYLGVSRGFGTILIAHVAFNIAFVVVVLQSRLRDLDPSLAEAARDLGSSPWNAFWLVTMPVIFPAILSASLLAAVLSIDDFIITSFVAGQKLTFPLWVYGSVKVGIPPQVFAMGTLIFAAGVLIAIAGLVAARRSPAQS